MSTAEGPRIEINMRDYYKVRDALNVVASRGLYRGAFRDTITAMLDIAKRYAEGITHVYSGQLKASHVTEYEGHRMRGSLHVDQHKLARGYGGQLRYPPQFVFEYATYEHARGGSHAFYERTIKETGGILEFQGINTLVRVIDLSVRRGYHVD